MRSSLLGTAVGLLVVAAPSLAHAADYTWIGPPNCGPPTPCGGDWLDPQNWSPHAVPGGADDTATINGAPLPGGTPIDNMTGSIRKLTVTGNTSLTGAITLAPTNAGPGGFTWSGGSLGFATVVLAAGTTSTFQGAIEMDGSEIDNAGNITWLSGVLAGDGGSSIHNTGSMTVMSGTSFSYGFGTDDADIFNTGTFTFTGPGTLSDVDGYWGFHNAGRLVITSGVFELHGTGNTTNSLDDGGHVSGAGVLRIAEPGSDSPAAGLVIDGVTTIESGATVEIGHGAIVTGSGEIDGPGTFAWTGGQIAGGAPGDPIIWGPTLSVHITGAEVKDLAAGTIDNEGTVRWDDGDIGGSSGTLLVNHGTFRAAGDLALDYSPSGGADTAMFENHATLEKTAGAGSMILQSWGLDNFGTVDVQTGICELQSAHDTDDTFEDGSTLKGHVRLHDPDTYAHATLAGSMTLANGAVLEIADQATFEGDGTVGGPGTTQIDGGEVSVADAMSVTFASSGKISITAGAQESTFSVADSGTLTLAGTTTWSSGDVELGTGTITNTGSFVAQTPNVFSVNTSGSLFDNQGTLTFDPGASGTVELDMHFQSSGKIVAKSGVGLFDGYADTFLQTAGSLKLAGGDVAAHVETGDPSDPIDYRTMDFQGGRLEGAGTVDAIVTNEATVAPGGAAKAGALTITQTYTQSAAGALEVELGGTQAGAFDVLDVQGDATIDGAVDVALLAGFSPSVGDTFKVLTSEGADDVSGTFATLGQPAGATVLATYDPKDVVLGVTHVSPGTGTGSAAGGGGAGGAG
ncbi:MAG TPA: hypothetical protein VHB21_19130, partial [Minicystis sp.]|nr:hypothetical protein [Minicystis sp.]